MKRTLAAGAAMVGAVVAGLALTGAPALATPSGPGVSGTIQWQTTVGDKDYILREVTIPPGQATGWHTHPGVLYGVVKKGTLSHFDRDCKSDGVYRTGQSIVEPAGADKVHIGINKGRTDMVLEVLYVLPHGAPLSVDAPNPGCDFQ
ncbi:cupin domain-containing protein [Micromonospora sp. NPDC049230]|uniref:cupin domain-containing protein n=1 Tax=Micromonospora sp. NPDC049230 TaxID=3155502 RepID=UPI0033E935F2